VGLPWFRFYTEWADDPKVQMLSEPLQRRLAMLFCYQGQGWLAGASEEELSFKLRISLDELEKTRVAFQKQGFIGDSWLLVNWEKRQKPSDISTPRVHRHRQKKHETVSETVVKQCETKSETNETVLEERRGEEIRVEQNRLEQKRKEAARSTGKRSGSLASISSIFSSSSSPTATLRHFPTTVAGLLAANYAFSNKAPCKDCGVEIDWWLTPKGGQLPMNAGSAVVHMETCTQELRKAN
jgi:hypothetical protein